MEINVLRLIVSFMLLSLTICADQTFSFYSASRNKVYTVTTHAIAQVWQWAGHWQYEPSVVTPSTPTSNKYVMLFTSNTTAGQTSPGESIFMSTSTDGITFSFPPQPVLSNTTVGNLCDMADARPVWDGTQWHVYIQAVMGTYGTVCPSINNVIVEATGPDFSHLSWVVDSGNNILPIIQSPYTCVPATGACGMGERQQWFNTSQYGGSIYNPFLVVYNDYNYSSTGQLFGSYSPDGTNLITGWYNAGPAFTGSGLSIISNPDAMLAGSLDYPALGSPAISVADGCAGVTSVYNYGSGIGFFPDPYPYTNGVSRTIPPPNGIAVLGPLESVSSDVNGPHMFTPRLARNPYGYIEPTSNSPKTWQTYLYYNDRAINTSPVSGCGGYTNWPSSTQGFSVSSLTVTEAPLEEVSPPGGSGANQAFTVNFSDSQGWTQLTTVEVLINSSLDGIGACYVAYVPGTNTLYLVDDAGDAGGPYAGTMVLSGSGSIHNSQCTITGSGSSAVGNGSTLALTLNVTFSSSFTGNKVTYLAWQDSTTNTGWLPSGTWGVPPASPGNPIAASVSPTISNTIGPQSYAFAFTDSGGWGHLTLLDALINSSLDGIGACYVAYVPGTNTLYLVDDAGDAGGPYAGTMVLSGSGSIHNSQCTITGSGSSAAGSGNSLVLTLNVSFSSGFTGNRVMYLAAQNSTGNTGWQPLGIVTVP